MEPSYILSAIFGLTILGIVFFRDFFINYFIRVTKEKIKKEAGINLEGVFGDVNQFLNENLKKDNLFPEDKEILFKLQKIEDNLDSINRRINLVLTILNKLDTGEEEEEGGDKVLDEKDDTKKILGVLDQILTSSGMENLNRVLQNRIGDNKEEEQKEDDQKMETFLGGLNQIFSTMGMGNLKQASKNQIEEWKKSGKKDMPKEVLKAMMSDIRLSNDPACKKLLESDQPISLDTWAKLINKDAEKLSEEPPELEKLGE